jgi:tetratricopeptide (TPR) repeat protein
MNNHPTRHRRGRRRAQLLDFPRRLLPVALIAVALSACNKQQAVESRLASAAVTSPLARGLAAARLDAAKTSLDNHSQDQALALLVAALKVDPSCGEAEALLRSILTTTVWSIPVATISHQLPVEHLAFSPPSSLWVSLAENIPEGFNTTVRWDTQALQMESVLFPARNTATRCLVVGHNPHAIIIQRGSGPSAVTLLCNAKTLRPICDIGPLPDNLTLQSVIAFSDNGLLIAHPGRVSASDPRLIWRIRDAASGEVICSCEPVTGDAARPLTAQLDTHRLRVVHADGSLLELPVSPVLPVRRHPPAVPLALLHAQFNPAGDGFLALLDQEPDHIPRRLFYQISSEPETTAPRIEAGAWSNTQDAVFASWMRGFPWSRQPSVWSGLLRDHGNPECPPPIRIDSKDLRFWSSPHAPIHSEAPITAVAFGPGQVITGDATGSVVIHQLLSLPGSTAQSSAPLDSAALGVLAAVLCGIRIDEVSGNPSRLNARQRLELLDKLQPQQAAHLLPGLDFALPLAELKATVQREAPAAALLPLWDRLASSDASAASWPRLLELTRALGDSRWHQDLTEAMDLHSDPQAVGQSPRADDASPWLAQIRIREAFRSRDAALIPPAIHAVSGKGPAAASALALAMDSACPEWIGACVESATDLPPLLRVLAKSRVAWLQQRKADAISLWPDEFPDYDKIRLTEDWNGWEQEDFSSCYAAHLQVLKEALADYQVSAEATADARAALAARLLDPATRGIIGRKRLADYCLKAALAFADVAANATASFKLASHARALGAQPEPCLRAEALALTRLADYKNARARWVTLLTEHPVATHEVGDYAEAAYTAFEIGEPNQAVEILTTGINRFPNDAGFALRAGWIAILTTNYGQAYQFLLAGLRIGFPDDKRENAYLLLAVAAAQAGFPDEAATHFHNLLEIAPVWAQSKTIDALKWPAELKASLHGIAR